MTAYGIVQALAFGIPSAFIITVTAVALYRWLRQMRDEREWITDVARKVCARRLRAREGLDWEVQFGADGRDLS